MEDVTFHERAINLKGIGLLFIIAGTLLAALWVMVPSALEGQAPVSRESLPQLAVSLYSLFGMSLLGYVLTRDLDVFRRCGRDMSRVVTMDWLRCGMLPFAAYVGLSALAANTTAIHFRHAAHLEAGLAASVLFYGLWLASVRLAPEAQPQEEGW